ncbi:hypothetical protein SU86_008790 [Candidatus Nitrosotenuis cloacae]|uniref:Uncharacterized protein n=1 Tax=Candidatus Nitrosotenuis cloacae TaxID=1603555 RepID=A0A3G1B874_9ARCH|nr:hypothetical protein SU86_008790 [Candidatus Nitrosotenuis cloacae]
MQRILPAKIDEHMEFFTGFEENIPLCCVLFYECAWLPAIRIKIPEYLEKMWELTTQTGVLLCPECLVKTISKNLRESDKKTISAIPN